MKIIMNMSLLIYFLLLIYPNDGIDHFDQEIWNYISDIIDSKGSFVPHIVEPISYQRLWQTNQHHQNL